MSEELRLAELCERAEGPDRKLGREVLLACGWTKSQRGHFLGPLYQWHAPSPSRTTFDDDHFARYDPTSSLDAAMTLVPEGWVLSFLSLNNARTTWTAMCWVTDAWTELGEGAPSGEAATPALALCAAALKARASHTGEGM